jgi:hypothetical protein
MTKAFRQEFGEYLDVGAVLDVVLDARQQVPASLVHDVSQSVMLGKEANNENRNNALQTRRDVHVASPSRIRNFLAQAGEITNGSPPSIQTEIREQTQRTILRKRYPSFLAAKVAVSPEPLWP